MKKVLCIVGTRPEAIKMAPVINRLKRVSEISTYVLSTGQHQDILSSTLKTFGISPDGELKVMRDGQSLAQLTAALIIHIEAALDDISPSLIVAQGDTTSVMVAALVSFYKKIPFAHVEAGLRTSDLLNPFPEEFNRIVADRLAAIHFSPTESSKINLIREGVSEDRIYVTGNTVIDALLEVAKQEITTDQPILKSDRMILVSTHRRESFGAPLENIFRALVKIHDAHKDFSIIFPVHPNPNVRKKAYGMLGGFERIHLLPPLNYKDMVLALKSARLILTDSGGLQEEAPALGKPVLVLRETTERPEAVEFGVAKLVGANEDVIFNETHRLLTDQEYYKSMARGTSPYGDGNAGARIVEVIEEFLR